jgi:hypothetical protein
VVALDERPAMARIWDWYEGSSSHLEIVSPVRVLLGALRLQKVPINLRRYDLPSRTVARAGAGACKPFGSRNV